MTNNTEISLAVKLYKTGEISLAKAAKLTDMSLFEFIEYVSSQGIPVVDFTEEEFDKEMAYLNS